MGQFCVGARSEVFCFVFNGISLEHFEFLIGIQGCVVFFLGVQLIQKFLNDRSC